MSVPRATTASRNLLSLAPIVGLFGLMFWGMGRHEATSAADTAYLPQMARYPRVEGAFLHDEYRNWRQVELACRRGEGRRHPEMYQRLAIAVRDYNAEAADCCPAAFRYSGTPLRLPDP